MSYESQMAKLESIISNPTATDRRYACHGLILIDGEVHLLDDVVKQKEETLVSNYNQATANYRQAVKAYNDDQIQKANVKMLNAWRKLTDQVGTTKAIRLANNRQ